MNLGRHTWQLISRGLAGHYVHLPPSSGRRDTECCTAAGVGTRLPLAYCDRQSAVAAIQNSALV
jgi:hypothetical protein